MPKSTGTGSALHNGMTWKRRIRVEKAARLTAYGVLSDAQIAAQIGISQPAFSILKSTDEFKKTMIFISTGIASQDQAAVAKNAEYQREQLADMVPVALNKIRDLVMHSKPEIALKAAIEVLDRDGKNIKVSRSSVTVENHVDFNVVNAVGNNILNILKAQPASNASAEKNTIDISSGETIDSLTGVSSSDIDSSISSSSITEEVMNEFTRSASDAKKQVENMSEMITEETLETIDSASKTIQ